MAEQTPQSVEPRWRRPEVVSVRVVAQEITFGPAPRFCTAPGGCGKRLSVLNTSTLCFHHQPRVTSYSLPRGQRPAVDRGLFKATSQKAKG